MNVKELKQQIESLPDDTEVFIRVAVNPCGNALRARSAEVFCFFGESIDGVIIEPEKWELR